MNRGVLAAVAAFVAFGPANAAETINFDPGTYSLRNETPDYRIWNADPFTVATKPTGDIANGYVSDIEVQVAYQRPGLIDLLSFDVRGTGTLKFQNFDKDGQTIFDQPFTTFNLTGDWQTIAFDTAPRGFVIRLTSDSSFDADNFSYGSAVPEPATWAMMVLGFGAIGLARRKQKPVLA